MYRLNGIEYVIRAQHQNSNLVCISISYASGLTVFDMSEHLSAEEIAEFREIFNLVDRVSIIDFY